MAKATVHAIDARRSSSSESPSSLVWSRRLDLDLNAATSSSSTLTHCRYADDLAASPIRALATASLSAAASARLSSASLARVCDSRSALRSSSSPSPARGRSRRFSSPSPIAAAAAGSSIPGNSFCGGGRSQLRMSSTGETRHEIEPLPFSIFALPQSNVRAGDGLQGKEGGRSVGGGGGIFLPTFGFGSTNGRFILVASKAFFSCGKKRPSLSSNQCSCRFLTWVSSSDIDGLVGMLLKAALSMDHDLSKWVGAFLLSWWLIFRTAFCVEGLRGDAKVRGVNLGGWLVVEGWIKPSLFDDIPNGDMLDGTQVQLKSATLQKYVCAENGGGTTVSVDRDVASLWETFTLWRISEFAFQFRSSSGQFLTCDGEGCSVFATAQTPSATETFYIERNNSRIHIKLTTGTYLQATTANQLTADYPGEPGWDDDNAATFLMTIVANNLHGDYQLANGYGHSKAKEVLKTHRNTFITIEDFSFLYRHGINTVRIPVGWWIAFDPNPPAPFIGGSLEALDNAFTWAIVYNIKCIIDLHAAPGSQNGMEHSASRDGSTDWPTFPDHISKTLDVIDFLAKRYAKHPALLGIELLNEPSAASVPLDILISYYIQGYDVVRKYSSSAYVIICQRIGNADPLELYQANIGSHNLVVDIHYYSLFDTFFVNMSSVDNIQFIYKSREAQLKALNNANAPLVFIGEWVNEWNVTSGSQAEYQDFGRAQLEVYNAASFGWAYWTLKNDRKHWDFEWNIRNNYLQLGESPDRQFANQLVILAAAVACLFLHNPL
ncbi:uncharacterized protein J3R85_019132 [Psidium guajava]|nr:uncharacterized protein J3R85_019132 [Psidium guajava]